MYNVKQFHPIHLFKVDIFWRRAIFGGGKKIHCLMNADCLDFDVSDAAERHLEQYIQETSYTGENSKYTQLPINSFPHVDELFCFPADDF